MTGVETKETRKNIGKLLHSKCSTQKLHTKRSRKPKTPMSKEKLVEFLTNSKRNDFKCRNASHKTIKSLINPSITTFQNQEETAKCENTDLTSEKLKKRRKRKRTKNKVEVDEASRLQGRTRYLLFKMRKEQNLLDAYSTEGWKGQRYLSFLNFSHICEFDAVSNCFVYYIQPRKDKARKRTSKGQKTDSEM